MDLPISPYNSVNLYMCVCVCWERQSCTYSLPAPAQLHKNGPWSWNTSLLGHKKPTQPVLGSWPCENLFLFWAWCICTPLFCLSLCVSGHQARPQLSVFRPWVGGVGILPLQLEVRWCGPLVGCRTDPLVMGDQRIARGWILCTFYHSSFLL